MEPLDINTIVQLGATTAIALFLVKVMAELITNKIEALIEKTDSITEKMAELVDEIKDLQRNNIEITQKLLANQQLILLLLKKNGVTLNSANDNQKN